MPKPITLYKYLDYKGGWLSILNLTLRWTSTICFNDPFEESIEYRTLQQQIGPALLAKTLELVEADKPPNFKRDDALARDVINKWRNRLKSHPASRDDIIAEMRTRFESMIASMPTRFAKLGAERLDIRRMERVLCLSEVPDDLLMWAHYAESHQGVVLEFDLSEDRVLSADHGQMQYDDRMVPVSETPFMTNYLLGLLTREENAEDATNRERLSALTKSTHWQYEKEWRCFSADDPASPVLYSDVPVEPVAIKRVILGCRMTEECQKALRELVRQRLPHATVLQATTDPDRFALDIS